MIAITIANTHPCESAFLIVLYFDNMQNVDESKIMNWNWLYTKCIYSSLAQILFFFGSSFYILNTLCLNIWNLVFLILVFHLQEVLLNKKLFLFQQNPVVISNICCNSKLIFVCMKFSRNCNHILCIGIMKSFQEIIFSFLSICM